MLFDSHSHLHFCQFDNDREDIIKKLRDSNIKTINVGTDLEESRKALELSQKYPDLLWASVGLHPNDLEKNFDIIKYKELATNNKVVAIGECGLDYFRSPSKIKITRQKEIFIKQIELAKELNKPLILHCRPSVGTQNAYEDAIEILEYKNLDFITGNGVAHFFSGSKEIAKKFLDLGFYVSFAGPITFPFKAGQFFAGANQYKDIIEFTPIDRILIETDAPFAAPMPHRGKRNEPIYVEFIAWQIAEYKSLGFEIIAEITAENAVKIFKIK